MASDPRRRNQILLSSHQEDNMEEDEDEDELFETTTTAASTATSDPTSAPTLSSGPTSGSMQNPTLPLTSADVEILSNFITPSPFPHHTTGPTSSRFRNAFTRITAQPTSDVEAWQALLTEVANCYRSIQSKQHLVDAEIQLQLDWVESCYGTFLRYFPYHMPQTVTLAQLLLAQSALPGEEEAASVPLGSMIDHRRQQICQVKLENLLTKTLGITMEGEPLLAASGNTEEQEASNASSSNKDSVMGMGSPSVELWMIYIATRRRQARREHPVDVNVQRTWTTQAYELAVEHAGFTSSNHILWKSYLQYVKSFAAIDAPQQHMVALRTLYQRLVTHPMTGLDQLWQEYEQFERQQSEALAQALIGDYSPKYQHARTVYLERNRVFTLAELHMDRLATSPNPDELSEEHATLQVWKRRVAYERTNPERVSASEAQLRIRAVYKEFICAWTQHPEVWHMWSMWEETTGHGGIDKALAVLQLAQKHIPDCTLLASAQAQLVELHSPKPSACMQVLETFLERSPNTLAYTLYQQMVRRYKGKEAARAVFSKARRVLKATASVATDGATAGVANPEEGAAEEEGAEVKTEEEDTSKRWMVTNRLDPKIGVNGTSTDTKTAEESEDATTVQAGPITWHLYASHAAIEHRLNESPEIAARIYELGLRKHATFLTQPSYVLRYAQLLLELRDTVNLRALLTRALAACKDQKGPGVAALWDMNVQFESLMAIADPSNVPLALAVERKRRAALMGPDMEDVATGMRVGMGDAVTIGAQKATIGDQLVRQDGYDMSSNIVSGLSRSVDVLDLMGLWGTGFSNNNRSLANIESEESFPGGKSDLAYQKRLNFATLLTNGMSPSGDVGGDSGSRMMSARERLGAVASQNTVMAMAIQNSPEWLRDLLLLLPASRMRTTIIGKPPPHLTEQALALLRQSKLPAERPEDDKSSSAKRKISSLDGDSSDEEGATGSGGYGTQFRARQRARLMASGATSM
eukprot:Nitzschia sp. Nitz4//scaffold85_size83877//64780//67728//NITZ4_005238-RA/size83877-processed-gene-0.144-mRNA-1//-1//CDS//3329559164//3088//frame0